MILQSDSALTVVENTEGGEGVGGDEEVEVTDDEDEDILEVVQPTAEWQTLRPGNEAEGVLLICKHFNSFFTLTFLLMACACACMCVAGQAVPAGVHVRLNLQTGQREVRLGEEQLKYVTQKHRCVS